MILTLNGGSSSLKFALYQTGTEPVCQGTGQIERVGKPGMRLDAKAGLWGDPAQIELDPVANKTAIAPLIGFLRQHDLIERLRLVGHRIVHGGPQFVQPTLVRPEMIEELQRLSPFDPNHLPAQIELLQRVAELLPGVPQFACFDTAFHQAMPEVAKRFPLPRRYFDAGVRRYGFHGLSYTYLRQQLVQNHPELAQGRIIMAHLGSGCSMAAMHAGQPIDTTMGFTPTAGLMMGTRTGDLDPGLPLYFAQTEGMSTEGFNDLVNRHSGLLGVSGLGADVRDLLQWESERPEAAQALALFCHIARKTLASLTASLGGLDGLVFSGGIGEKSAEMRNRLCQGLDYLGIALDPAANAAQARRISANGARVWTLVIPTDEEAVIARAGLEFLSKSL